MLQPERLAQLRRVARLAVAQNRQDIRWPAGTILALLDHITEVEHAAAARACHCLGRHETKR